MKTTPEIDLAEEEVWRLSVAPGSPEYQGGVRPLRRALRTASANEAGARPRISNAGGSMTKREGLIGVLEKNLIEPTEPKLREKLTVQLDELRNRDISRLIKQGLGPTALGRAMINAARKKNDDAT